MSSPSVQQAGLRGRPYFVRHTRPPRSPQRGRPRVVLASVAVVGVLVGGCTSTTTTVAPTRTASTKTTSLAPPSSGLATADYAGSGTAHGCGPEPGLRVVSLTVNPDGLTPSDGCVQLTPGQRLKVVNKTNGFGQSGKTVALAMRGLPTMTIAPGASAAYPEPISSYLATGQHYGTCSSEPGSTFDLWLLA
jgi:hypothetical protein